MMSVKEQALQIINSYPEYAKEALENVYRRKMFVVFQTYRNSIEKIAKTKRGAEGYIKKQQAFTYYDEYTNELVTCGSGLTVVEIDPTQIENPKTSKTLWYRFMKEYNGQTWYYDNIVKMAKQMNVSDDVMEYILQSVEDMKNNRGLTVLEEAEQPTTQQEQQQANVKATYTLNEQLNGIEIAFNIIPSEETRNELKAQGFRWSKYKKVWYAKQTAERLEFAKMLAEEQTEEVTEQSETQQAEAQEVFSIIPEVQEGEANALNLQFFNNPTSAEDVLNMFDSIDLTQEKSIISDEDQEQINKLEESYRATLSVFENHLQQLQELHGQYGDYFDVTEETLSFLRGDVHEIEKRIERLKSDFISKICRYFTKKYNITIDIETIQKKHHTFITAQEIISEIIEQLDGFSFIEKAQQEIKQQLQKETTYIKINVKNNKISLNSFFYIDSFEIQFGKYKISYNSYDRAIILFKALYLFDSGATNLSEELNEKVKSLRYGENNNVFTTHELNMKKVKSIKLYKNGRVDIEFISSHYAREFTKDFLNIVKVA